MGYAKLALYGAVSTALAAGVVHNALETRHNFYAAAVQVGRSSGAIMVLVNFCCFVTLCIGLLVKAIFFGQLRPVEVEHLYDRAWFFFTESMLALTIFRDEFDAHFITMFILLLFLKAFHWLSIDRVEYMDQVPPPGPSKLFHVRMTTMLLFLTSVDVLVTWYCIDQALLVLSGHGGGSMVLFASEYTIMTNTAVTIVAKYLVNLYDLRRAATMGGEDAPQWEEKSMWIFYVELASDALRLVTYGLFFYTIFAYFGSLPINHIHSLYATIRSFTGKLRDLVRYRTATRNMDERYPDATEDEVGRLGGGSCVICREEMVAKESRARDGSEAVDAGNGPNDTPKKLACGHVFHFHCLRSWLERQQSCPTCRRSVLDDRRPATPAAAAPNGYAAPPPPQPGQTPVAPPQPAATAAAPGHSAPQPRPADDVLGIWGGAHIPLTIRPPGSAGPAAGLGLSPTLAPPRFNPPTTGDSDTPSRRGSGHQAITPLSSQAPTVFTPPSQSHFDRTIPAVEQAETPAQLAAAAALRRLMKSGEAGPAAAPTPRQPYLVPLQPSSAMPLSLAEPPTLENLLQTASRAVEQLHQAVRRRYRHQPTSAPTSSPNGDTSRHADHLAELERIESLLVDSMIEVAKSASLAGPSETSVVQPDQETA